MSDGAHEPAADPRLEDIAHALSIALRDSPDAAFVLDSTGCIVAANPTLCSSLQVEERQLLGRTFDMDTRSIDTARVEQHMRAALTGVPTRYRSVGTRTSGGSYVAEVTLLPLRVEGEVAGVLGTAVDLTEVDRHDVELRRSEELLRLAGRIARFGGWSVDAETRQVSLSQDARLMLGIPDDTPDLTSAAWALHPEGARERVEALLERCLATGEPFDIEGIMVTTRGEQLCMRTVGEAQVHPDGRIVGAHGAIWDVTDTVAARERERALEARLSAALTSISDGIYFLDSTDRLTYANPRALEMLRFDEETLRSTSLWELFPEAVEAGYRDAFDRARRSGERVMHRAYYEPFDRWFETTAYPANDGLAVYLRDVTDDERARAESRRAQEKLQEQAALLDTARDAMVVRDLDNHVQYWNAAATRLYGWTEEEALGRRIGDLIYSDVTVLQHATEMVMRDGYFADEIEQRDRDGRTVIVDCRWQLLTHDDGTPRAIFTVNTDITEYRRELDARQRAQRMESLGTLAGGIAHDLNNVLTPILMSVQLLESDENDPEKRELLATMETAVKRGAEMIRQVLTFARGVEGRRVTVDVDQLLDELVAVSRDALPRSIALDVQRSTPLPSTVGDPTQLLQVLVNLVTNAKDAMEGEGRLLISAGRLEIEDEYSSTIHAAPPGEYIAIAVEDDGHGMSADVVAKIFEPFFTTKAPGKGTGLGLATSLAIMHSHGGFMKVYSELDSGTRFVIGLPVIAESVDAAPAPPEARTPLPTGEGELVLVVDDDETIRLVTCRTLEANGYRTLSAAHGREAIELIESGWHDVDLVLTDMMMPVMDGAATSAYLEEHHPGIPIIAASGLNSGGSESRSVGMGISRFLAKPYTTSILLRTVHETLHDPGAIDEETE